MKKSRILIGCILILLSLVFFAAACDGAEENIGGVIQSGENGGEGGSSGSGGSGSGGGNSGSGQGLHVHGYQTSSEWSYDETVHWHQTHCADCGAPGENTDRASHTPVLDGESRTYSEGKDHVKKYYHCEVCDFGWTEESVEDHAHTPGEGYHFNENGHYHYCSVCSQDLSDQIEEHDWDYPEWRVTRNATYTSTGSKHRTCKVCGYEAVETIPVVDHDHDWYLTYDEDGHWEVCTICDETREHHVHEPGDWDLVSECDAFTYGEKRRSCSCGWTQSEWTPAFFDFENAWEHGEVVSYTIKGVNREHWGATSLTVPASYRGKPIVAIKEGAFANCAALQSLSIPFAGTDLGTATGTTHYPVGALFKKDDPHSSAYRAVSQKSYRNTYLTDVTYYVPTSLKSVTISCSYVPKYSFMNMADLERVVVDTDSAVTIGEHAFEGSALLTFDMTNVAVLERYAFKNCSALNGLTFTTGTTSIGRGVFDGCDSLEYSMYGGLYYLTDNENRRIALIKADPAITSATFENYTAVIADYAFEGCNRLREVNNYAYLQNVGPNAFYCPSLWQIRNHSSVRIVKGSEDFGGIAYYAKAVLSPTAESIFLHVDGVTICTEGDPVLVDVDASESEVEILGRYETEKGSVTLKALGAYAFVNVERVLLGDSLAGWGVDADENAFVGSDASFACSVMALNFFGLNNYNFTNVKRLEIREGGGSSLSDRIRIGGVKTVVIPSAITEIRSNVFSAGLTERVIYGGTTAEWAAISFGNEKSNPLWNGATLIASDSEGEEGYLVIPDDYDGDLSVYGKPTAVKTSASVLAGIDKSRLTHLYLTTGNYDCSEISTLRSVVLGSGVTQVASYAFGSALEKVTITEVGDPITIESRAFARCSALTEINLSERVTEIGSNAFYSTASLQCHEYGNAYYLGNESNPYLLLVKGKADTITSCEIHADAKMIYSGAFREYGALSSVTIPSGLRVIGEDAFEYCSVLEAIVLPSSVAVVGEDAFRECRGLTSIEATAALASAVATASGARSFRVTITAGEEIEERAFYSCTGLTEISIAATVERIGDRAFEDCSSLRSLEIPVNAECGSDLCSGCTALSSIVGPAVAAYTAARSCGSASYTVTITSTGDLGVGSEFRDLTGMTEITIPEGVQRITESYVFRDCTALQKVNLPDSLCYVDSSIFEGCTALEYNEYDNAYYLGNAANPYVLLVKAKSTEITSCEIADTTRILCYRAFAGCSELTEIEIPASVKEILGSAFYGCTSLQSITVPFLGLGEGADMSSVKCFGFIFGTTEYEGSVATGELRNKRYICGSYYLPASLQRVTVLGGEIPDGAFYGCERLTEIRIPASITSIGYAAFAGCSSLESIYFGGSESAWNSLEKGGNWNQGTTAEILFGE